MCGVWRGYDVTGVGGGEFALRLALRQRVAPLYWRSDTHTHTQPLIWTQLEPLENGLTLAHLGHVTFKLRMILLAKHSLVARHAILPNARVTVTHGHDLSKECSPIHLGLGRPQMHLQRDAL